MNSFSDSFTEPVDKTTGEIDPDIEYDEELTADEQRYLVNNGLLKPIAMGEDDRTSQSQIQFLSNLYEQYGIDVDWSHPRFTHKWFVSREINRLGVRQASAPVGDVAEMAGRYHAKPASEDPSGK